MKKKWNSRICNLYIQFDELTDRYYQSTNGIEPILTQVQTIAGKNSTFQVRFTNWILTPFE